MASAADQPLIDVGRVIQRGFSTLGANLVEYLGLALVLTALPTFAANYFLMADIDPLGIFSPASGLVWLVSWISTLLLQAALVRSSILSLSGRPADPAGSLVAALALILPTLGIAVLTSIGIFVGLVLLIVPGIILYIMWIVSVPVLVEERRGVIGSMKRSAELTEGARWPIFGLLLIGIVFAIAVGVVFGFFDIEYQMEKPLWFAVVAALNDAVTNLVVAAVLASLYVELRTVKEGATADTLAAVFN